MSKYEIMLLVDASINESEVLQNLKPIFSLFDTCADYKYQFINNDPLAYPIKKQTTAHRCILNFSLDDVQLLKKFNEQAAVNKFLLRHLVINIEKDYGYKATVNAKKLKSSQIQKEKYQKYLELKESKLQKLQKILDKDA